MELDPKTALHAVEYLLDEFFSVNSSNTRKQEIEQQLNTFKSSPKVWNICVYFLENTDNQYVVMFALCTLETVITQQWNAIELPCRERLKRHIQQFLIEKAMGTAHYVRSKYSKLLVGIARYDCPQQYPEFFDLILELLRSDYSQLVGLVLLRISSEEFMGVQCSFEPSSRKNDISRLFHQYIPIVFDLLNSILLNLGNKPQHSVTATPPPSPTHTIIEPVVPQQLTAANFKPDLKLLNKEALNTVQHLFTWTPINQIPSSLLKSIFHFTNISSYAQNDDDACVLAMSAINELLYRKCTPPGTQDFFRQLFFHTVELLKSITNTSNCRIDTLDPIFIDKLAELLVLLIDQHLWRFEVDPNFRSLEILSLLFQLTMELPLVQCYLRCLNIWYAIFKHAHRTQNTTYLDAFLSLLDMLLNKMQFSTNAEQLSGIDDVELIDENDTEWQIFLRSTNETIALIAEQGPQQTFNHVLNRWNALYEVYSQLELITTSPQHRSVLDNRHEIERLIFALTDFSSLTQCIIRLLPVYFEEEDEGETFASIIPLIGTLLEKVLLGALMATHLKLYSIKTHNQRLNQCFIDNQSHLLAALKSYVIWNSRHAKLSHHIITILLDLSIPILLDGNVPVKVGNAASQLLLSLTNTSVGATICLQPNVEQFIKITPTIKFSDPQTKLMVYKVITNLLLKPVPVTSLSPPSLFTQYNNNNNNNYNNSNNNNNSSNNNNTSSNNSNEEKLMQRNQLTDVFFESLTWNFRNLNAETHSDQQIVDVVQNVLSILTHIVDTAKDFPIASKKRLFLVLKSSIEHAILLFPTYVHVKEVGMEILEFFLSVLKVLQQQFGVEGTQKAVEVFLNVAIKQQAANNFVDKLLQIFRLVIESPGNTYKTFLPSILQLCMDNVYPFILRNNDCPDNFIALIKLLHSILLHRWQYFQSSQVRMGCSPGFREVEIETNIESTKLLTILQVFGQGLLQEDINIFKLSLHSLENLNVKWKLYYNVFYRFQNLSQYVFVLLQTMIQKSQYLLLEDIQIAVYHMAAVNFDHFFAVILPEFIQNVEGLDNGQKHVLLQTFVQNHDRDMPTFIRNLHVFTNTVQHFRITNHPVVNFP